MASRPPLTIIYAPAAGAALEGIFDHNAEHRGFSIAESYERFLIGRIRDLARNPMMGKAVAADPTFRYLIMRKRSGGAGHVAAYRVDEDAQRLEIVRIYHTSQDWRTYLEGEGP